MVKPGPMPPREHNKVESKKLHKLGRFPKLCAPQKKHSQCHLHNTSYGCTRETTQNGSNMEFHKCYKMQTQKMTPSEFVGVLKILSKLRATLFFGKNRPC